MLCFLFAKSFNANSTVFLFFSEAVSKRCSVKKVFLEIFQNSQENTCVGVSFYIKLHGLNPATLFKNRPWYRCFPVNFAKFLRTTFFTKHFRWLLLSKFTLVLALMLNLLKLITKTKRGKPKARSSSIQAFLIVSRSTYIITQSSVNSFSPKIFRLTDLDITLNENIILQLYEYNF